MARIAENVVYLHRASWNPDMGLPRLGYPVPKLSRTHVILHHTVIIDLNDATPNLWETEAEVKAKMRQLQRIRPDLGLDVPYNFVIFLMVDGRIFVCEGRGEDRTGAHTHGHNTAGIGVAFQMNSELARDIGPYVDQVSAFLGWLRYERGMENLGSKVPPDGDVFGHRSFRDPNDRRTWTACPGEKVWARINEFTFKKAEEDNVDLQKEIEKLREELEAQQKFQNKLLVGAYEAIKYLGKIAVNHEERITALEKSHP